MDRRRVRDGFVLKPHQRVGVFVDIQNMYYSAKHLYNAKVNFKKVLEQAVNGRQLIRAIAYGLSLIHI